MIGHARNERGIALVLSVVALVMLGAIVAATFTPSLLEQRTAENMRRARQAFDAAEYGLAQTMGNWNSGAWNQLPVGGMANFSGAVPSGSGLYDGTVGRLNDELFLVDVTGVDGRGGARQRIGHFFKLTPFSIDIAAALTTMGTTRVGGNTEIDGNDMMPAGWTTCPGLDPAVAGLRLFDEDDLNTSGANCEDATCINGNPPVLGDSTIGDSTFFQYGDLNWDDLTAMATKILPDGTYRVTPTIVDGECDTSQLANWGDPFDPSSPCFTQFPVVYAPEDLNINGVMGQGILLVDGNLWVQGGFEFYGIAIVRGQLRTTGTGGHFNGAVLAANVDLDDITVLGDALVQYSSCAVLRALDSASPARPLRSRGWLHTY